MLILLVIVNALLVVVGGALCVKVDQLLSKLLVDLLCRQDAESQTATLLEIKAAIAKLQDLLHGIVESSLHR